MSAYYLLGHLDEQADLPPKLAARLRADAVAPRALVCVAACVHDPEGAERQARAREAQLAAAGLAFSSRALIDQRTRPEEASALLAGASHALLLDGDAAAQMALLQDLDLIGQLRAFEGAVLGLGAGAANMGRTALRLCAGAGAGGPACLCEGLGLLDVTAAPRSAGGAAPDPALILASECADICDLPQGAFVIAGRAWAKFLGGARVLSRGRFRDALAVRTRAVGIYAAYRYVVIFARYEGRWLYSRHRARDTWESAGGHIEPGETPLEAARRELWEETGARDFDLRAAFDYAVYRPDEFSYGQVFLAHVRGMGPLPDFEMAEVRGFDAYPERLTYPAILPVLFSRLSRAGEREIERVAEDTRALAADFLAREWGGTVMMLRGEAVDLKDSEGFLLRDANGRTAVALATYRFLGAECEITSLACKREGRGIGTSLILRVKAAAEAAGCHALSLTTTNDNLDALRLYQKLGFDLTRLGRFAVEKARAQKPQIPILGECGIPLRHELELSMRLGGDGTVYRKLVRDRIPDLIRARGGRSVTRALDEAAYREALDQKLDEEAREYLAGGGAEELCDLLEVVEAIAAARGISPQALEAMRREKLLARGGFTQRIWLERSEP